MVANSRYLLAKYERYEPEHGVFTQRVSDTSQVREHSIVNIPCTLRGNHGGIDRLRPLTCHGHSSNEMREIVRDTS
jgi:hypothetical protein